MKDFFSKELSVKEIVLCCYVPAGTGTKYHKNRQSHGLALTVNGQMDYDFGNGKIIKTKKDDIVYLPKNSNYKVVDGAQGDVYAINFQLTEELNSSAFSMSLKSSIKAQEAFLIATKAFREKKLGFIYDCKSRLYNILCEMQLLLNSKYLPSTKLKLIQPAIDFIHERYADTLINVGDLSKLCGISYEYFRRIFEEVYNLSPIKYINNLKIKHSQELMASGLYTITECAYLSGFSDMSHFSRFFKSSVGITPKEYFINLAKG